MIAPATTESELWRDYRTSGSVESRNRLVEYHYDKAEWVARRLGRRIPKHVRYEELLSAACEGLIDAVTKFDSESGFKFSTYASRRIRGSVLDWIRGRDEISRRARETSARNGTEVPKTYSISPGRNLSSRWGGMYSDPNRGWRTELIEDRKQVSPINKVSDDNAFSELIRPLDQRERLMMNLMYKASLTMKETGREIGVSESRICQMHQLALERLRATAVVAL